MPGGGVIVFVHGVRPCLHSMQQMKRLCPWVSRFGWVWLPEQAVELSEDMPK